MKKNSGSGKRGEQDTYTILIDPLCFSTRLLFPQGHSTREVYA